MGENKHTISLKESSEKLDEIKFSCREIIDNLKYILGKTLTVVDATMLDEDSRKKHFKNLIKNIFVDEMCEWNARSVDHRILEVTDEEFEEAKKNGLEISNDEMLEIVENDARKTIKDN